MKTLFIGLGTIALIFIGAGCLGYVMTAWEEGELFQ